MITEIETAIKHAGEKRRLLRAAIDYETVEAQVKADIANETDPETGKAVYSNAEKRDAEFCLRMAGKEDTAAVAKVDAGFHADMVRIYCSFAEAGKGAGAI